ncbi:MAG: cation-translocating P-type ATPase [Streptococcaceae bacterium]|jgi:Cd2+/Zn2+-exporting ATPase|nr:cation-translocating P-type ATPase [Streptococcaceae bacterium]
MKTNQNLHTNREGLENKPMKSSCCSDKDQLKGDFCGDKVQSKSDCCSEKTQEKSDCCSEKTKEKSDCCSEKTQEKSDCCSENLTETSVSTMEGQLRTNHSKHVGNEDVQLSEPPTIKRIVEEYRISGMDCGSCALTIKKDLEKIPGVEMVDVAFATAKMKIQYQPEHVNKEMIVDHVSKIGYSASTEEHGIGEKEAKLSQLVKLGILFFLIGLVFHLGTHFHMVADSFFIATLLTLGLKIYQNAYFSLKSFSLDMNVLMSLASIAALFIGEVMEGAMILFLFQVGLLLQSRALRTTKASVESLIEMSPKTALVRIGVEWEEKNVEDVQIGDILLVRAGEKLPLDGVVRQGFSEVDESLITGESLYSEKGVGSNVYAGTMNQNGVFQVEVTQKSEDSTISNMGKLVERAGLEKSTSELFVDKFAQIYTPLVFVVAMLTIFIPVIFFQGSIQDWGMKGLEVLIIACPCALVISTPVTIVSAIHANAKHGILVKNGIVIENASKIKAAVFDKTGTLTEGVLDVEEVVSISEASTDEILLLAASLEQYSTHPIAESIVKRVDKKSLIAPTKHETILGLGVKGIIGRDLIEVKKAKIEDEQGNGLGQKVKEREASGARVIEVVKNDTVLGFILLKDKVKPYAKELILELRNFGLDEITMLTGDTETVSNQIGHSIGLTSIQSNCLPEDKLNYVQALQSTKSTMMVGDGMNDSPTLAYADVSISMGAGASEMALETASVVLVKNDLSKIPLFLKIAKRARGVLVENLTLSILVKIAAFILIYQGIMPIWLAVLSDSGVSVLVILNALRLQRK